MAYRPEIDVLRAIAVLSVLGFHWNIWPFSGGFVGVDIFFVISGFLITRIIFDGLEQDRFSFFTFYERRVRRILPALYFLIAAVLAAGAFILLPGDLEDLGKSAAAASLFSANILFYLQVGYFDQTSLRKPLLHIWSLAVEEQFYLVFPMLIWLLARYCGALKSKRRLAATITAATAVAILVVSQLMLHRDPLAAFYLLPSRAWEFLIGATTSLLNIGAMSKSLRRLLLGLGTLLMGSAIFGYTDTLPFPGIYALVPDLGAALFIAATDPRGGTLTSRFLVPIGTFYGRISYSLYLWHWPTIVFIGLFDASLLPLSGVRALLLFALTTLIAYGSYRFVERPVRNRHILVSRAALLRGAVSVSLLILIAGGTYALTNGLPMRFNAHIAKLTSYNSKVVAGDYRIGTCFLTSEQPYTQYNKQACFTPKDGKTNILLWGDSVAAHYVPGLQSWSDRAGFHLMQATAAACAPLYASKQNPNSISCQPMLDDISANILVVKPTVLVLSANWRSYDAGLGPERLKAYLDIEMQTLASNGISVIFFGPSVEYDEPLPQMLVASKSYSTLISEGAPLWEPISELDGRLQKIITSYPNATYVSIINATCPGKHCPVLAAPDEPMQWDRIHLTPGGSHVVINKVAEAITAGVRRAEQNQR